MEKFKTDGTIISNEKGDCMGIFSATNLLNIRAERIKNLESLVLEVLKAEGEATTYGEIGVSVKHIIENFSEEIQYLSDQIEWAEQ